MRKDFAYIIIIAFLLGMVFQDYCFSAKVPDIILPNSVDADLQEKLDYITDIINGGKYAITISSAAITSADDLDAGIITLDNAGATKYLCLSNGTTNYRVEVTAIP